MISKELSEQEYGFIVNYLGDRQYKHGIHTAVRERFPDLDRHIAQTIQNGDVIAADDRYILTDKGKIIRKAFRSSEREKANQTHHTIMLLAVNGKFLDAYNARVDYENSCVIPHGINVSLESKPRTPQWTHIKELTQPIKTYIAKSCELDFSDLQNSPIYKAFLQRLYIGAQIGSSINSEYIPPCPTGEILKCTSLDEQSAYLHPTEAQKVSIYLGIKQKILNGIIQEWDGRFVYTEEQHNQIIEFNKKYWKEKRKNNAKAKKT